MLWKFDSANGRSCKPLEYLVLDGGWVLGTEFATGCWRRLSRRPRL